MKRYAGYLVALAISLCLVAGVALLITPVMDPIRFFAITGVVSWTMAHYQLALVGFEKVGLGFGWIKAKRQARKKAKKLRGMLKVAKKTEKDSVKAVQPADK